MTLKTRGPSVPCSCATCGLTFLAKTARRRYCDNCRKLRATEYVKLWHRLRSKTGLPLYVEAVACVACGAMVRDAARGEIRSSRRFCDACRVVRRKEALDRSMARRKAGLIPQPPASQLQHATCDCGATFERYRKTRTRCPGCRREHLRSLQAIYNARNQKARAARRVLLPPHIDKHCMTCDRLMRGAFRTRRYCDVCGKERHRRVARDAARLKNA